MSARPNPLHHDPASRTDRRPPRDPVVSSPSLAEHLPESPDVGRPGAPRQTPRRSGDQLGSQRRGARSTRATDDGAESSASHHHRQTTDTVPAWLKPVAAAIHGDSGLTELIFPQRLARGVMNEAERMSVSDVVDALAKCQGMALKVKAAAFLRKSGAEDIQDLRAYAEKMLMSGGEDK